MKIKLNILSQYKGLRKEIYILCVGRIVTSLGSMIWPMMTLIMNQRLGFKASDIAIYFVATSLIMMPANLAGGKIADKFNKKMIIVYCDIVSIVCYIVCGVIPLSMVTVVLMVIAGIFQSIEGPAYNSLCADLSTVKDRDRVFSLGYLCMNLGMVLSPTIGGILFKDFVWLMFILCGVSIGISTVMIYFLIKDITPVEDDSEEAEYQNKVSNEGIFKIIRQNKEVMLFVIVIAIYYAAYGQWGYLMPLDMGRVHGDSGALIYGTVSSLNCIVVVLFTPIITHLFKKFHETQKLLSGELLLASGYFLFITLLGHIPVYYAAIFLFTLGEIFSTIAEGPYLTRRIPASHRGRLTGISAVAGTLISGVADLTVGHLYDKSGSVAAWAVVLSLLGGAFILTAFLTVHDKKKYPKLYSKDSAKEDIKQ